MHFYRRSLLPATGLAVASLSVLLLDSPRALGFGDERVSAGSPYDSDPQHLWNRLHEAIFVRAGPDRQQYGRDRLDPLLWSETAHLGKGEARDRVMTVLNEFLDENGERLITEPVRRAVLQRDLWLIFNWLETDRSHDEKLAGLLAAVIGRLALSPDQIRRLPDNYVAAIASGEFPARFDPERPDEPFLPPDLFAPDGRWVCVGRPDGPVAPQHLRENGGSNPSTNSVFLVFLRLPGGRGATLDFLNQLRSFDQPLLIASADAGDRRRDFLPNAKLPQVPVGTEMALVRQALLIDSSHVPVASTLSESVQLRVYREVPEITAQAVEAGLGGGTAANRRAQEWQSFYEFRLSRPLLFAGRAGGLRAVNIHERDFETGFAAHGWDPFERREPGRLFPDGDRRSIRESCFACHSLPGVLSLNSFSDGWRGGIVSGKMLRPAALSEVPLAEARASGIEWKKGRSNWLALRDLLSN